MKSEKTVLIVGAGVAGLATGIALAEKGFNVKIFEKNVNPGGRCGRIVHEGHRFDLGATIFLMPSIYKEVFNYLGLTLEKDLPAKPLPIIYKLYFPDGKTLDFTTDKVAMKSQLEKIEPGSYKQAVRLTKKGYRLFKLAYERLLSRNFTSWYQFVTIRNLSLLFRIKTHIRHQTFVKRFFKDPNLQIAFSFQNIYVGQNPLTAPALFSMLSAAELSEGSIVPQGGMYGVVETLLKKASELGVEINCNKPVDKILTKKDKATGLHFEDGSTVEGDLVVANADLPYVYRSLLQDGIMKQLLEQKQYSCSAIVFHWGLNKRYLGLGHHGVFFSSEYKSNLDNIFRDNAMGDEPSFYTHAPVCNDPSAAPDGHDTLSIVIPTGHLSPRNRAEWDVYKQKARRSVIRRLKKEGFADIDEHIKFELNCTPSDWEKAFNVTKGSVFGSINHNILQMGYFRPHNKHRNFHNLYFAGGSTHPGSGVPLVLLSAKLVSERIVKDHQLTKNGQSDKL
jgi:phytoene desaturase